MPLATFTTSLCIYISSNIQSTAPRQIHRSSFSPQPSNKVSLSDKRPLRIRPIMYTVRKLALAALMVTTSTLSSPVAAGLAPPPVECIDGQPVGANLQINTLPDPFTIQVISRDNEPGSLPLVLGKQLGTSDFNRISLGDTSQNPGLSFTLSDGQVDFSEALKLTLVTGRVENTLDLGIGPGFPYGTDFVAEYVCRSDNTPVLALLLPNGTSFLGDPEGREYFISYSDNSAPSTQEQRNSWKEKTRQ